MTKNSNFWQNKSIESLCLNVTSGGTPSRKNLDFYRNGTIQWIKTKELKDWYIDDSEEKITDEAIKKSSAKLFPPNTVLMAMYGDGRTITSLGILRNKAATNQACCALIVNPNVCDYLFLFYALMSHRNEFIHLALGGAQRNLNGKLIRDFVIKIPPPPTQRKIAAILSAYDNLIENNTQRIKILEEMAQALYREWFVKFRFPGHEKVKMVESELGMVPEGWKIIKLCDVAKLHRGKSYRSTDLAEEGGLPFLNLKCIERDGGFRYDGIKRFQGKFKETQTAKSGDIIMAITDMTQERRLVAHAARVPVLNGNISVISMDLIKIEPMPEMHKEYIYGILRFSEFADKVKQYANGANVLHLSPDRVADFKFALPPSNLRSQYSAFCSNLYQQCDNLNIKNPNLRRTRDLLLPKLISSELNVQNFDINTINNKT